VNPPGFTRDTLPEGAKFFKLDKEISGGDKLVKTFYWGNTEWKYLRKIRASLL